MPFTHKVVRQPHDHEVKRIVTAKVAQGCAPKGPPAKDLANRDRTNRSFRTHWGFRHPSNPWSHPDETNKTQEHKDRTPTVGRHKSSKSQRPDGWAEAHSASDYRVGKT